MQARFGSAHATYFRFYQWAAVNMTVLAAIWTPFLVIHLIYTPLPAGQTFFNNSFYPTLLNYSSFTPVLSRYPVACAKDPIPLSVP